MLSFTAAQTITQRSSGCESGSLPVSQLTWLAEDGDRTQHCVGDSLNFSFLSKSQT